MREALTARSGIRTTAQFNTKIFYPDRKTPNLWSSDPLDKVSFENDKLDFHAQGCSVQLSDDGKTYTIKSQTNKKSIVDLKVTQIAPGFVVGENGTSFFGTDAKNPWGKMRHAFWPRCTVEGSIITQAGPVDFKGRAFFAHALQGMKPHHAGKSRPFTQARCRPLKAIQPPAGTLSTFSLQHTLQL